MLSTAFTLSGCMTHHLWSSDNTPNIYYQNIGSDKIHAFGHRKTATEQIAAGSLIMMGERYWYALDPTSSNTMQAVLTAKLSQRYQIFDAKDSEALLALPALLSDEKNPTFSSRFCLRYDIPAHLPKNQAAQEQAELQRLAFNRQTDMPQQYRRCFKAAGQTFAKPENSTADHHFEHYLPVSLEMTKVETQQKSAADVLGNIIMTPIALVADAAIAVVAVPAIFAAANHCSDKNCD